MSTSYPTDPAQAALQAFSRRLMDPAFRSALRTDARAALASAGVRLPEGVRVTVLESTPTGLHLVLPAPRPEGAVEDDALEGVQAGTGPTTFDLMTFFAFSPAFFGRGAGMGPLAIASGDAAGTGGPG